MRLGLEVLMVVVLGRQEDGILVPNTTLFFFFNTVITVQQFLSFELRV